MVGGCIFVTDLGLGKEEEGVLPCFETLLCRTVSVGEVTLLIPERLEKGTRCGNGS